MLAVARLITIVSGVEANSRQLPGPRYLPSPVRLGPTPYDVGVDRGSLHVRIIPFWGG
jgi:hypothetical protein